MSVIMLHSLKRDRQTSKASRKAPFVLKITDSDGQDMKYVKDDAGVHVNRDFL